MPAEATTEECAENVLRGLAVAIVTQKTYDVRDGLLGPLRGVLLDACPRRVRL